ncbi:Uma2 family endonuclease [Gloeocapsa sp. PCC 73106]|uniref:Uma2 family endonuclease n=1 Tax=Gloeocapsa sp. PCC 73106 TaxID=102232 RepID=UPI0002ACD1B5|nr:Uma2 family endonuclease [Gloeocapsa sp. PCC 73106]ELR96683.1 hypothetical protein GLO73106DRAFT_00004800 [Gloeocapsa sp. PCC 73106]
MNLINVSVIGKEVLDAFEEICAANPELRLELSAKGELITLSPTGMETGDKNSRLISRFVVWNESTTPERGLVFDSSTGFKLPNGAIRSPDVSWISKENSDNIAPEERKGFAQIAPDFVLELISESDSLKNVQDKMLEYIDAGVKLGWLLNPYTKTVEIYRQGEEKQVLVNPPTLRDENVLADFVLDLKKIF